jgi:DNA polymerase-3 subunit gamma/tau
MDISGLTTLSLKAELNPQKGEAEEDEIPDYSDKPRTAFTLEELMVHWNSYIEMLKRDKRSSMQSTLESCKPTLQENFVLKMTFHNKVQRDEFNNEKTNFLGHLRENLNNWGISIESEVKQENLEKRYYTNRDRFERMTELNPKLAELRKRLNLDPDF